MNFDGTYSKEVSRVGIILMSPGGKSYKYSFSLKFGCKNNVFEYKALLLGLQVTIKHGIKMLRVLGDFELVVSKIREKYESKNKRLKKYKNVVWDYIEMFDTFSIEWVERSKNFMADFLANIALRLDNNTFFGISMVETQVRPSILYNVQIW